MTHALEKVAAALFIAVTVFGFIAWLMGHWTGVMALAETYWYLLPMVFFGLPSGAYLAFAWLRRRRAERQDIATAIATLTEVASQQTDMMGRLVELTGQHQDQLTWITSQLAQQGEQMQELAKAVIRALRAITGSDDDGS